MADKAMIESEIKVLKDEEKKAESKVLEEEFDAAFDEEFGKDWLQGKSLKFRLAVQFMRFILACGALYFFLVSIIIMSDSFSAMAGKEAGELFTAAKYPIVGLMIGTLATVFVHSSSTVTSIVVVLVGNGLISVKNAFPIVMGANIGTSVTNSIVSLGFVDNTENYRRGFAGATVHDLFNVYSALLLFPLELLIAAFRTDGGGGLMQELAEQTCRNYKEDVAFQAGDNYQESNPLKKIASPIVLKFLAINKGVIEDIAQGFPNPPEDINNCDLTYKFQNKDADVAGCEDGRKCDFCPGGIFNETLYDLAEESFNDAELIKDGALAALGDKSGGIVGLILAITMLLLSLLVLVRLLTLVLRGSAKKLIIASLNFNFPGGGYLSILVGTLVTLVIQSSTVVTSTLTPLAAVGALELENMYTLTLGANIGTTGTGVLAALAAGKKLGLEIAMVHVYINIVGVFIFYSIPFMKNIVLDSARFLGNMAAIMKIFPFIFILCVFVIYPLFFFGLSVGFRSGSVAGQVVAGFMLFGLLVSHLYVVFWYLRLDGKAKFVKFVTEREAKLKEAKKARMEKINVLESQLGSPEEKEASL